jgi:hypothetical protein
MILLAKGVFSDRQVLQAKHVEGTCPNRKPCPNDEVYSDVIRDGILMQKPTAVTPPCVYVSCLPWGVDGMGAWSLDWRKSLGENTPVDHHGGPHVDAVPGGACRAADARHADACA